jgi:hypothetical protein
MGTREHVQLVHGPGCMCIRHQQERAEAAAKVECVATPDLRDSRVTHAKKDVTAAVRRARWRKKNPEHHRVQQRAARARRKASS